MAGWRVIASNMSAMISGYAWRVEVVVEVVVMVVEVVVMVMEAVVMVVVVAP